MERFDVIIIGSGIGGLMTGAALAKAKKKVLILEKAPIIGGKYTEIPYKGYLVTTGAWANLGPESNIGKMCENLGCKIDYVSQEDPNSLPGLVKWKDGSEVLFDITKPDGIQTLFKLYPEEDWSSIMNFMTRLTSTRRKIIKELDKISVRALMNQFSIKSERFKNLVNAISFTASGLDIDTIMAGELGFVIRELNRIASKGIGYTVGGTKSMIDELERVFIENKGEIRVNSPVKSIFFDKNEVSGVELDNGSTIYSEIVIHNAGAMALLRLAGEENLPEDLVERIKNLIPSECGSIILGLTEPLWEKNAPFMVTPDAKRVSGIYWGTFLDKSVAPPGKELYDVFFALQSDDIKLELQLINEDLHQLIPNLDEITDMRVESLFHGTFPATESAQAFGQIGDERIDPALDYKGPRGLYMVGMDVKGRGAAGDLIPVGVKLLLDKLKAEFELPLPESR